MRKRREITSTIIESLELPQDLFEGMPNIFLTGNRKLYISNHRGILAYEKDEILILTKTVQIKVHGEDLIIESYSKDELVIRGYIYYVGME
jgi:sporulation protein YqfC